MPTYGQHPSDVVQDSRGNALSGVLLQFHLTEAEARSSAPPVGSAVTDEYGSWQFTTDSLDLWTRLPNGKVWQVAHSDQAVLDAALAAQAAAESAADSAASANGAGKLDVTEAAATYATKTALADGLSLKADSSSVATTYETKANVVTGLAAKLDTGAAASLYETKANVSSGLAAKLDTATASSTYETKSNVASGLTAKVSKGAQVYDIRDYGATTASTDNRSAIANALAAASAAGGGTVRIPPGTWNVKATTGRTFTLPPNVTVLGDDRKLSRIRVHESSGDWAYLFAYPSTSHCDNAAVRNLTIDGATNTSPTDTAVGWVKERSLFNTIGKNITIENCDLLVNGIWAIHHVGDNLRFLNNDLTVDMRSYTFGWFDQSVVWGSSQGARVTGNTFTTLEATTNPFVVQTAIEFQAHRNTLADNKTTEGSRFTRAFIFTANTYFDAQAGFNPATPKGAVDSLIEGNTMTVTKYGVEIWGMVITSPLPIDGLRIRRNNITVDSSATVGAAALVSTYVGTAGASGNDGPQTSPIKNLKISDNLLRFTSRRVSTSYDTGDCLVRLTPEVEVAGVVVSGNRAVNCGGFGVLANVAAAYSTWIDGLDITDNVFSDVREPVKIVRNVRNYRVEGNTFEQTQVFGTLGDNMIETVAHRPGDWSTESNGVILRNTVRTTSTHRPYYPLRDHGISQAYAPPARGYVVEEMASQAKIQIAGSPLYLGNGQVARRYSDGVLVKPSATMGATLSTVALSGVTIASVINGDTMTVNDATNLYPGMVLALPTVVFTSPTAFVLAVVGTTVKTAASNLNFQSGKGNADAVGQSLTYYGTVVTA